MFLQINHRNPDPKRKLADAFTQHCRNHAAFWSMERGLCVITEHYQFVGNLKKARGRFYSHKTTQAFDFSSAWSSPKPVILFHLIKSLSNESQSTVQGLCGMLNWALVDQQTRGTERPLLRCFVSGPASGPILSSFPSLLGHFGPFPCLWDSRLEFCPVKHQWAIAGEQERGQWKFEWVSCEPAVLIAVWLPFLFTVPLLSPPVS